MKRYVRVMILSTVLVLAVAPAQPVQAGWIEIIRQLAIKVIKAIDLAIQKQQNKTILLQNAQKALENTMAKLKLDEITDWTRKQKKLYEDYFAELRKVKELIQYYQRIKETMGKLYRMGDEHKRVWALIQNDKHFSLQELAYMKRVYEGIHTQTEQVVMAILDIVKQDLTSMSDVKRLERIEAAADKVDALYAEMVRFTHQNQQVSLQRARSIQEAEIIKELYGLP
ncbi:hypothetical protein GCM10023091_00590 [Ravibacter arvi]|uniref:Conjugal transfer protein TraI n=1 Tax=Ravibacter arvi TaxID=2051041 RepID=A0ABP8LM14_9BACT